MGRTAAKVWHASLSIVAAGLYFFFVLPRWFELTGFIPHTLGTVLRVVTAVVVALGALPVALTMLRARQPEFRTPKLALQLLVGSIVGHLAAGVLILGTAISEIWLSLDRFGPLLFGIYGAAAAVALLGIGAFYLAFVAEMPPPPPKPIEPKKAKKVKEPRQRRKFGKKITGGPESGEDAHDAEDTEDTDVFERDEDARDAEDEDVTEAAAVDSGTDSDTDADDGAETPGGADDETPSAESETDYTEALAHSGSRHKLPRGYPHKLPTGKRRSRGDR
ncbi:MAG TPA: hypothetical protein VFR17_04250 [Mycobacterium sp.]|nr:hypothetical protein [Mycobacterium sp.]